MLIGVLYVLPSEMVDDWYWYGHKPIGKKIVCVLLEDLKEKVIVKINSFFLRVVMLRKRA